ncbi:peptidoglycan-binding protein, partial [Patescibacteria group bacterium]|nr:peptidoglycan-binding protein [Patescibacteria group bacterium]
IDLTEESLEATLKYDPGLVTVNTPLSKVTDSAVDPLKIILTIFFLPIISLSATNDFVASSNMTVADVTFGDTTVDMIILSGSTAESVTFDSGVFTVTNPGSYFKVASSDSSVKSIQVSRSGGTVACSENTTAGTSYTLLPTNTGTYTIRPSATTQCTDLCTLISHTSTYNTFPTCGSATCVKGYMVSGSGANATCIMVDNGGGVFTGSVASLPGYVAPRQQTVYADGTVIYADEEIASQAREDGQGKILSVDGSETSVSASDSEAVQKSSYSFLKNLYKGIENSDVINLQQKLRELNIFKYESNTGYYGTVTEQAVQAFQCKYNIICTGTAYSTGYGVVGPKTREVLNSLTTQSASSADNETSSLEQQIVGLQKMVEALLKELEGMIN